MTERLSESHLKNIIIEVYNCVKAEELKSWDKASSKDFHLHNNETFIIWDYQPVTVGEGIVNIISIILNIFQV